MADRQLGPRKCWSTLPDGSCEHIASHLPRTAQLACRQVCRGWRRSFAFSITQLALDSRWFGAAADANIDASPPADLPPEWHALTAAIGPALRSFTVRVSLLHESKTRTIPSAAACVACLRFLASVPAIIHQQERLQLQLLLPLRFALPPNVTDTLAASLTRLTRLRLVRCSLTQQAAAALGRLTQLRHLCIAHADLAALPQLLATEAAAHLEHIHVHGYHSLAIMEDNPHMRAVWRAAEGLMGRSRGREPQQQQQQQDEAPEGAVPGGGDAAVAAAAGSATAAGAAGSSGAAGGGISGWTGANGGGRLQCLAISAHHLYSDAVLDESELDFEAEAVQWQIRFDRCNSGRPAQASAAAAGQELPCRLGGCCRDPHEDPGAAAWRGTYAGGGSGGWALCAAALAGIQCSCCCCCCDSGGGSTAAASSRHSAHTARHSPTHGNGDQAAAASPGVRTPAVPSPWELAPAVPTLTPMQVAAGGAGSEGAAEVTGALQLLRSAKRSVQLLPPELLLAELARSSWRHLQYVQLALTPGLAPPGAAPTALTDSLTAGAEGIARALATSGRSAGPSLGPELYEAATDVPPATHRSLAPLHDNGRTLRWPMQPVATLEALNGLPALRGVWLDPGTWEEEAAEEGRLEGPPDAPGAAGPPPAGATASAGGGEAAEPGLGASSRPIGPYPRGDPAGGSGSSGVWWQRRGRTRWVRVGDVWAQLHEPAVHATSVATTITADAHAPVQDLAAHAALLAPVSALRSLALGQRHPAAATRGSVLGVGDDTAELLVRLSGLTKLHVFAAYTLPLGERRGTRTPPLMPPDGLQPPAPHVALDQIIRPGHCAVAAPMAADVDWTRLPPRLTPLGALTGLQRLALHFVNPPGRPAVVSHAALPPSLTSLSLHGVVLVPPPLATTTTAPAVAAAAVDGLSSCNLMGCSGFVTGFCSGSGTWSAERCAGLERLRELSLTSSYIGGAELIGCGPCLRVLSLRDSGLALMAAVGDGDAAVAATASSAVALRLRLLPPPPPSCVQPVQDDRNLVGLLRRWHAVQTLCVHGSTATSKDVRLPEAAGCLDWHSAAGLRTITACLPSLRQLHLAPPPHGTSRPSAAPAAAAASVATYPSAAAAVAAATSPEGGTVSGMRGAGGGTENPRPQESADAGPVRDPHQGGSSAAVPPARRPQLQLPSWRLTNDGTGSSGSRSGSGPGAAAAGTCTAVTAAAPPSGATAPGSAGGGGEIFGRNAGEVVHDSGAGSERAAAAQRSGTSMAVTAAAADARAAGSQKPDEFHSESEYGPGTESEPEWHSESESESGDEAAATAAADIAMKVCHPSRRVAPREEATRRSPRDAVPRDGRPGRQRRQRSSEWLAALLRLLCRRTPHLRSLRVSWTAPDRCAAARTVQHAVALLPGGLRHLDSLSLTLDLALPYMLAQPEPEGAAREWAGWLRVVEADLQAQMRFTAVAVAPHPLLLPRVRDAVRGRTLAAGRLPPTQA